MAQKYTVAFLYWPTQQLAMYSKVSSLPQNKQWYLILLAFLLSWESLCNVALVAFTKLENQKGR